MTMNMFDIGWPWMGLGAAVVILILMFGTNTLRSGTTNSRWWDPTWLAWLAVPLYLLHQFEEYPLHYNAATGTYTIVESVNKAQGTSFPMAHYPLVNIALVWVAAPIAALLCRRNPVVGLTYYGFILANGLLHVVSAVLAGGEWISSPGVVTGGLFFIPCTVWVSYVCLQSKLMTGKALAVSLAGGFVGHVGLAGAYALFKVAGEGAMFLADVIGRICSHRDRCPSGASFYEGLRPQLRVPPNQNGNPAWSARGQLLTIETRNGPGAGAVRPAAASALGLPGQVPFTEDTWKNFHGSGRSGTSAPLLYHW